MLYFCVSVLGRLRDLQCIFAVTYGSPSIYPRSSDPFYIVTNFKGSCYSKLAKTSWTYGMWFMKCEVKLISESLSHIFFLFDQELFDTCEIYSD